jgi:DNA polymerase sigma
VDFSQFPQHVTSEHFKLCNESRKKMQINILGFAPEKKTLEDALYKKSNPSAMDSTVVSSFNRLSSAMGKLYEKEYLVSEHTHQQREVVRAHIERIVAQCDAFPPGTRVLVFGSSANGFGSPTSDLDMCLQPPPNTNLPGSMDDATGSKAMAKLADLLEQNKMKNVDTIRLTARIPVIKFNCPRPMALNGEDESMECDLSFVNSLAVLNTSLLSTYAMIHPVPRILAGVIKRWAKARDINNPSKHSLSSYGYIIMLLHFLTYHRRSGNGLISSFDTKSKSNHSLDLGPLLPNLQWMDPKWLQSSERQQIPYTEFERIPVQLIKHPLEDKVMVNTYFHRINNAQDLLELQRRFPSRDLSLAILLTTFFRYFAFEFDYKRHIVSLHSHARTGKLEREIKAEFYGWKVYSTGLAIEDPFETFYDVAHVVKGSNFHRLRNEMALAYTKIITSVESGRFEENGMDLINLICEPIQDDSAT